MSMAMSFFLRIAPLLALADGLRTRGHEATAPPAAALAYSFDEFVRDFARSYQVGSEEYVRRAAIFRQSLSQIVATNSLTGRSWTAGVYPFMDLTAAERSRSLHGYAFSGSQRVVEPASPNVRGSRLSFVSTAAEADTVLYGGADESFEAEAPEVRNQGLLCGSCWAFAAVEAVEAQLMQTDAYQRMGEPQISVQAVLECVTQEQTKCPETGGCKGATPDLAFQLMQDVGVPLESDLPYINHPVDSKCPVKPYPSQWMRVTLAGWRALPSNQAQPLMQAIVKEGPVVVAADSHDWYPYKSGIFDGCKRDAIPNHSVLAKGYGASDGQKYWLIQNTWGARWGEEGSIRLLRHDDEDQWCGSDSRPEEATAQCGAGSNENVTVCGACGLLFDPLIPQGVDISSSTSTRRELGSPPASASLATDAMDSMIHSTEGDIAPGQDSGLADEASSFRHSEDQKPMQDIKFAEAVDDSELSPVKVSPSSPSVDHTDVFQTEYKKPQSETAPAESHPSKLQADFQEGGSKELQDTSQPHGHATLGTYLASDADPLLAAASSWQIAVPGSGGRGSSPLTNSKSSSHASDGASDVNKELDSAMDAYVGATTTSPPQLQRWRPEPDVDSESLAAHRIAKLFG